MRSTICGPNVRLGTKWLSITSTCTRSAVAIFSRSRCMLTKSADRMLGLIRAGMPFSLVKRLAPSGCARFVSSAMNMASVPCRCGHSCTLGRVAGEVEAFERQLLQDRRRVERLERCRRTAPAHPRRQPGLRDVRRAGDVGEHAARLQRGERADRAAAPAAWSARPHPAASCASGPPGAAGARRDRCTARRAGCGRSAPASDSPIVVPSRSQTSTGSRDRCQRVAHELGAGGNELVRDQGRTAGAGFRGEQRGLAARAGAQVEPELARLRRAARG